MKELDKYKITLDFSIRKALKQLDDVGISFIVCVDEKDVLVGVITDGDFRRAVYAGINLDDNVENLINREFIFVDKNFEAWEVEKIFDDTIVERIPVLENGKLVNIILEEEFVSSGKNKLKKILSNTVVIMAGGKGTRLDPFTRILPKPLIPLGNDPVIKVIMDEFGKFGMKEFFITVNDKGRMIKAYFHDYNLGYQINYIDESKPLGTAGALKYLEGQFEKSFFVSNCDIIVHANYSSIYEFHTDQNYDLTIVGSMKNYTIPYGVCKTDSAGMLIEMREKPEYDFLVNTGLYLMEPSILKFIPKETYFDMTDLIRVVKLNGFKIGVYPVSEKSWIDVGQWSEFNSVIKDFEKESLKIND